MSRPAIDLARVRQLRDATAKHLPAIEQALGMHVEFKNPDGEAAVQEQLAAARGTLWLCRVATAMARPVVDAEAEVLALRAAIVEMGSILGQAERAAQLLVKLGKLDRIDGAQRVQAEFFLADVQAQIQQLGAWASGKAPAPKPVGGDT